MNLGTERVLFTTDPPPPPYLSCCLLNRGVHLDVIRISREGSNVSGELRQECTQRVSSGCSVFDRGVVLYFCDCNTLLFSKRSVSVPKGLPIVLSRGPFLFFSYPDYSGSS